MIQVKFKKLHPNARIPEKAHDQDFCYDCYAVSEEEIAPNVWRYGLGFALQIDRKASDLNLDDDCEDLNIDIDGRPRSSVWKTGMVLANCEPTIDEIYTGEIKVIFYHVFPNMPRYKIGDKLLQIKFGFTSPMNFVEVDELNETERGAGGFGSTGN